MPNPTVLSTPTRLYHPAEPEGRVFQAGEPWPGDAWSAKPGGAPAGAATNTQALKDLLTAHDQIEALSSQVAANANDRAIIAAEREEAVSKLGDAEQRAIAAESAQKEAETAAAGYMAERDSARAELEGVKGALAKANEAAETARATIERLTGELATANQALADASSAPAKPAKAKKGAATEDAPVNPAEIGAVPKADS